MYFYCYVYVFLLLCMFCVYCFHCVLCIAFVYMCTVLLPPGVNPIAVNKYTVCPTRYRTRLAGGPLLRVSTIRRTTDTFLFISHTTNVLLFKFRCSIFIGIRIIKEMPGW